VWRRPIDIVRLCLSVSVCRRVRYRFLMCCCISLKYNAVRVCVCLAVCLIDIIVFSCVLGLWAENKIHERVRQTEIPRKKKMKRNETKPKNNKIIKPRKLIDRRNVLYVTIRHVGAYRVFYIRRYAFYRASQKPKRK